MVILEAKNIEVKAVVDRAIEKTKTIEKVIVCKRTKAEVNMKSGRDFWWHELLRIKVQIIKLLF